MAASSLIVLLLVLISLLIATSVVAVISSLRIFVIIRLLLVSASLIVILSWARITVTLATSVVLVATTLSSGCGVDLVHLSLLDFSLGLHLDFLVLLPSLVSIIEHVSNQKLESLTDGPATFVFFHALKARKNFSLFF